MPNRDRSLQKRRLPTSLQWILFIALLLGVAFLVVYLFRDAALNRPIREELRRAAAARFGDGGRYEFGPIRGSYIRGITVHDVLLVPEPGTSPIRRIHAERVNVGYNVVALLQGRVLESLQRVDVEAFSVVLRVGGKSSSASSASGSVGASLYAATAALHQLPDLRLSGAVILDQGGPPVSVGLSASGTPREGVLLHVVPDPSVWPVELPGTLSLLGIATPGFIELSTAARTTAPAVQLEFRAWTTPPPDALLRRVHGVFGFDGSSLRLQADRRSMAFSAHSDGNDPVTKFLLEALPFEADSGAWRASATARARAESPPDSLDQAARTPTHFTSLFSASASARMEGWRFLGTELQAAHATAAVEGTSLRIGTLEAVFTDLGKISVSDMVFDPRKPRSTVRVASLRGDVAGPELFVDTAPEPYRALLAGLEGASVHVVGDGPDRYVVNELNVRGADFTASAGGSVALPADRGSWEDTVAQLTYTVRVPRSSGLPAALGLPDGTRLDMRIRGSWDGTLRGGSGSVSARDGRLFLSDTTSFDVAFGAQGTLQEARLERLSLTNERTSVVASGTLYPLREPQLRDLRLRMQTDDLGSLAAVVGVSEASGSGSLEAEGSARIPRGGESLLDALQGSYRVSAEQLRFAGQRVAAASAHGTVGGGAMTLEDLQASSPGVAVEAAGEIFSAEEGVTARLPHVRASLGTGSAPAVLSARDAVVLRWRDDSFTLEPVVLSGGSAQVRLAASGPKPVQLSVSGRQLPAGALFRYAGAPWEAEGSFRVNVAVERLAPELSATFGIAAEGLRVDGKRGSVTVSGSHDATGLAVSTMDIDFGKALDLRGSGVLPFVLRPGGESPVRGVGPQEFVLRGTSTEPYRFLRPILAVEPEEPYRMDDAEMEVRIRRTRDGSAEAVMDMHVSGAPVLSAEGSIRRNAAVGGPVMLQADAAVDVPLALAVPFLPGVLHMAGSASGSFSLSGPLARPTPRGTIQVEQGAVRVAGDVPTFSLVDATVSVDANGIRLSELYAELGHAPLRANGSLTWSEGALQVSADLTGTDALLVRTPDLRGRSDLDVSVRGTLPNLRVSGDLRLTDVLYTRPVQLVSFGTPRTVTRGVQLFSLRGPVAQGTTLDVSVQGPDAVRIDNNLLQTTLSADLRIGGTAAVPEPEGRLFTDTGTVRLPLSTLQIQQAELRFPRDRAFQPTLRAQLQTRMDQRRIVAAVSGPLSDLAVDVSSSPPLPNDEVLLLLTTGSTSSELTESVTYRETAAALGTYLSRRVLQEIAGTPRDGAVVDRLSVQVDPGIVTEGQGGFRIQYRVDDEEPWYVILERQEDDRYSLEFAYRLWF